MDIIHTNSSFCGSGKTFDATTAACQGIAEGKKTCIAVPSRRLAKQVLRDACHRFPELKSRIACFVSNPRKGETAIGRITKYLLDRQDDQGHLLIVTHAALQMIAHWRSKTQWHLIVDEEITSECHIPVRLKRPETRAALCGLFYVRPWDDHYSVLEAVDHGTIMDIRDHLYNDQIDEMFAPLTMRLLPSSSWNLFVKTTQWQQFVAGESNRFDVHGLLHPQLLDGFASVKVMAANIEDTLMAAYWRKVGRNMLRITPKPVTPIGDRLTIKYLPVPKWSKRLRDKEVCEEDGTTVGEMYAQLCAEEAQKHDPNAGNHLFITNHMGYGDQGSPRPHGLDTGKFERTSLFYRPSHRPEMFLVSHLDGGKLPLNPYEWLDNCPQEVWMDNIHVEVIADDTSRSIDPPSVKPIYPNGGGLVQYGLSRWREMGPLPGGHRKFWYLAKCLYDGGLDRAAIEAHLRREKDIAHSSTEREAEIPAILTGFFGA